MFTAACWQHRRSQTRVSASMRAILHLYINLKSICSLQIRKFLHIFPLMSQNLPPLLLLFRCYSYNWFIRVSLPIHLHTYTCIKFTSFALKIFHDISFISLFVLVLRFCTISNQFCLFTYPCLYLYSALFFILLYSHLSPLFL